MIVYIRILSLHNRVEVRYFDGRIWQTSVEYATQVQESLPLWREQGIVIQTQ